MYVDTPEGSETFVFGLEQYANVPYLMKMGANGLTLCVLEACPLTFPLDFTLNLKYRSTDTD